jgi:hypothetical protein
MKSLLVPVLAAGALMLGACATTADQSAKLTPEQMKAELASVTQQITEAEAWMSAQRALGGNVSRTALRSAVTGRLWKLVVRRDELRVALAEAGYPRTAEEVRERIFEIDQTLAKRNRALASAGAPSSGSSLLTVMPTTAQIAAMNVGPYVAPASPSYMSLSPVPGSASPRSSDWRRTYRLNKERAALLAKLQTLEPSEN